MVPGKTEQASLLCIRVLNKNKGYCRVSHWKSVFRYPSGLALRPASPANSCICVGLAVELLTMQFQSPSPPFQLGMPDVTQNLVLFSIPNRLDLLCCPCLENYIKGGCQVCQLLPLANLCCILSDSLLMSLFSYFAILLSTFPTEDFLPEAFCTSQVGWCSEGKELLTSSSPVFKCRHDANGVSCCLNWDISLKHQ